MTARLPSVRRLRRDRRGAVAVEMALAAPLLVFILMAAWDLSSAFSARHDLVQAAARSAELATSYGRVRTDYAFLQTEALAAATAAGATSPNATVDAWLECNGSRQQNMNDVCPQGQRFARYVSVRVRAQYQPLFLGALSVAVPISGTATVRIQ